MISPREAAPADGALPRPHRVASRRRETRDTWTLGLEPVGGAPLGGAPGQFTMLYAFGVGEAPISISGDPAGPLLHTVRAVGPVTRAICAARPGAVLGARGPFGNGWPVEAAAGADVVVVAGGLGLAPLRPAVRRLIARRADYGDVTILYGTRTPADLLYRRELERWRGRSDLRVEVTVDAAGAGWHGKVGVVAKLLSGLRLDPAETVALVCGPEIMMRFTAEALLARGVPDARVHVSLERNMQCALGHCGHCLLGPTMICRDGPVYPYAQAAPLMAVREL